MDSNKLHVYSNSVIDHFIAESKEEAKALGLEYAKQLGLDLELYEDEEYTQLPDDKKLVIFDEDEDSTKTKKCSEWAADIGKGFLSTTEY